VLNAKVLLIIGLSLIWSSSGVSAEAYNPLAGMIWKAVSAAPGEDVWQTCRRHFGYDAIRARRGSAGTVHCFVPSSYLYGPGQSRQNFNR